MRRRPSILEFGTMTRRELATELNVEESRVERWAVTNVIPRESDGTFRLRAVREALERNHGAADDAEIKDND
jgi:hypothetical protein